MVTLVKDNNSTLAVQVEGDHTTEIKCVLTPIRSVAGFMHRALLTGTLPSFREMNEALNRDDCEGCPAQQSSRVRMSACMRERVTAQFGPTLPTKEVFEEIEPHGPFLEVGATTGLWSAILKKRGAHVITCAEPHTHRHTAFRRTAITHVTAPAVVRMYPECSVMMIWPEASEMAVKTLEAMQSNQRLIAVTEGRYGNCATEEFFDCLSSDFDRVEEMSLPNWSGAQDYLHVHIKR